MFRVKALAILLAVFCLCAALHAAPSVTVLNPAAGSSVSALTSISVTFNEAVTGVDADDLEINAQGASLVTGSGAGPYVFTFTQPPPGTVTAAWVGDHGIAGQGGTGAFIPTGSWSYTLTDTIAPTIAQRTPAAGATVGTLTQVEVFFNEEVTGVNASDLLINGIASTGMTGSGLGPYTFTFAQPSVGTVNFTWAAAHGIADTAASPNAFTGAGGGWSVTRSASGVGTLIINEFLAANGTGIADENGDQEDWIEIFNSGASAVNLAGWALTDNPDDLGKWVFPSPPAGWILNAGQYMIVYASNKNRKPNQVASGVDNSNTLASPRLHTNFTLSEGGGYVALVSPQFPRVAVSYFPQNYNPTGNPPVEEFPIQRTDYSYGNFTGGTVRYLSPPTPKAANTASTSFTALTPQVNMSVQRGYFKDPFQLVMTCSDATATIRYTTDFTEPTAANGLIYTGPITISTTTCLRAAAIATGKVISVPVTHTYLFLDQVITQSNTPAGFPTNWGTTYGSNVMSPASSTPGFIPADYEMDSDPVRVDPNNPGSAIDPVKQQRLKDGLRELPMLSITMSNADIFNSTGLYAYPNVTNKNFGYRKCSAEMILQDGSTAFAVTCGLSGHGNASREPAKNPKHGFQMKFKGDFGEGTLDYKLFEESPVDKFDDIILRPDFGTSWRHWSDDSGNANGAFQRSRATRIHDAWSKDTFRAMGGLASHHRFFHMYINGVYFGVYDMCEQPVEQFASGEMGGSKADYEIYQEGNPLATTSAVYSAMVGQPATTSNALYDTMKGYLDVPEFIDYMLLHFYLGHQDWGAAKNWYAIRRKASATNPTEGKFQYVPWDQECTQMELNVNRTANSDVPSGLHTKLISHAQYRLDFADRVHKHMIAPGGALTSASNIARWNKWQTLLDKPIVAESCRWGDYRRDVHNSNTSATSVTGSFVLYTRENQWLAECARKTGTYYPAGGRPTQLFSQLRTAGIYPATNAQAPEYRQTTTGGAIIGTSQVPAGYIVAMALPAGTSGTIYYTTDGNDPHIYYSATTGVTTPTVNVHYPASAQTYSAPLAINSTTTIKSRVLSTAGVWSALNEATFTVGIAAPQIRITELMYNPQGGAAYEFIEIQNTGTSPVDLSGWYMEGVDFYFPFGTVLNGGDRLVLASNDGEAGLFAAQYPGVTVFGWYGGALDNAGERIAIRDAVGNNVFSVHYNDASPWPSADGNGYSLELIDLSGDPDSPFNWKVSAAIKGSAGQANSPQSYTVRINEVLSRNVSTSTPAGNGYDFVEVINTGASPVNIGGWVVDALGAAGSYTFPGGTTLSSGDFAVAYFAPGAGTSLPDKNWSIVLKNSSAVIVDGVRYGAQIADRSLGRVSGSWTLCSPTPAAANSAVSLAPVSNLAINEWLANGVAGERDWLEVYNKHATLPVALEGLYFQSSTQIVRYGGLGFVAPQGYVQLYANEGDDADDIDFRIPAAGTTLKILDAANTTVDAVTFGTQSEGVTSGRLPDGTGGVAVFPGSASPAATNYLASSYTGPVLNEALARNVDGAQAPWGTWADWCELQNPSVSSVNLGGMRLGRTNDFGSAWVIPAGTSIGGSGFLAFWCDGARAADTLAGADMNTGYSLGDLSDGLYLFNPSGQLVSYIEWGPQVIDRSIGRDAGTWKLLASPTRAAANSAGAGLGAIANLRINEWAAALASDWVELHNLDASPVSLGGLYLSDDPGEVGRTKVQIAPLSYIGSVGTPSAWVKFEADNLPALGRNHLNFALATSGEYLRLSNNDAAVTAINSVSFGTQSGSATQGRISDGQATVQSGLIPTPGAPNHPIIFTHPQNITALQGTEVSFTVVAGGPALTYQWKRNTVDVPSGTNAILTLSDVQAVNEGSYTLTATDSVGSATSNVATLTVTQNLAQWATSKGLAGPDAAGDADPDFDGLTNLEEFYFNLNPLGQPTGVEATDSVPTPGIETISGTRYITLTYRINLRAAVAAAQHQISPTLGSGSWSNVTPDITEVLSTDPITGDQRVRVKVAVGGPETQKFLRLHLTQ